MFIITPPVVYGAGGRNGSGQLLAHGVVCAGLTKAIIMCTGTKGLYRVARAG